MFCDGKCIKGKKKCGLYWTVEFEDDKGQRQTVERCGMIEHQLTLGKLSNQLLGIQQVLEKTRNNQETHFGTMYEMVRKGFSIIGDLLLRLDKPKILSADVQDADTKELPL
jgi:hypothetical protein